MTSPACQHSGRVLREASAAPQIIRQQKQWGDITGSLLEGSQHVKPDMHSQRSGRTHPRDCPHQNGGPVNLLRGCLLPTQACDW